MQQAVGLGLVTSRSSLGRAARGRVGTKAAAWRLDLTMRRRREVVMVMVGTAACVVRPFLICHTLHCLPCFLLNCLPVSLLSMYLAQASMSLCCVLCYNNASTRSLHPMLQLAARVIPDLAGTPCFAYTTEVIDTASSPHSSDQEPVRTYLFSGRRRAAGSHRGQWT